MSSRGKRPGLVLLAIVLAVAMSATPLAAAGPASAPDRPAAAADFTPSPAFAEWADSPFPVGGMLDSASRLDNLPARIESPTLAPLATPTPEPATATFLALGSLALLWSAARKRRHRKAAEA